MHDELRCGELRVLTFCYTASDEEDPYHERYDGLSGIAVEISGPSGDLIQTTDDMGTAVWPDLEPGDYQVTVACPADRRVNSAYCSMRGSFENGVRVDYPAGAQVQNGVVTTVAIGLAPQPAQFYLSAYIEDENGDRHLIPAEFEFFQRRQRIGCVQVTEREAVTVSRHGLVAIRAKPIQYSGCTYYPEAEEIMVMVAAGELCGEVAVRYGVQMGAIEVASSLVDAQHNPLQPLPGAVIEVRRGVKPGGPPLRQGVTQASPMLFGDLEPGYYTVSLAQPPQYQNQQLDLVTPARGSCVVQVAAGGPTALEFDFQIYRARIQGTVLDSSSGDALVGAPLLLRDPEKLTIIDKTLTNAMGAYEFADLEPGQYMVTLAGEQVRLADGSDWEVADG
ncbi:MAG: hypothetical protein KDE31_33680, partial [Caldilineaceae bacterium]|nr:hypothetical protein [Caldilineaceae bacterium]